MGISGPPITTWRLSKPLAVRFGAYENEQAKFIGPKLQLAPHFYDSDSSTGGKKPISILGIGEVENLIQVTFGGGIMTFTWDP